MKRAARGICSWFIALALVVGSALPALAQPDETPSADTVATEGELAQWCEDHDRDGGTVTLTEDITITSPLPGGYGGGHIIIDTGAYGLTYDGGEICLNHFEITGQGVNDEGIPTPVVEVRDLGRIWAGNWNNMILANKITATGAPDGTGGIALRVNGVNDAAFDTGSIPNNNGLIQSFGAGAIGIEVMQPTDIHCLNVYVEGENSVAVSAPQGASLFYCRLSAAGTGAASVAGDVVLDACTASPEAEGMISRRIEAITGKSLFLPVLQNGSIFIGSMYTFLLRGSDGSIRKEALYIDWDYDVIDGIDTSALGTTVVPGALPSVFSGFGLEDDFSLELTVEVWDPEVPCIYDVFFDEVDGNKIVRFPLFFEYPEIALYRSVDGGDTWEDYTNNPAIEWSEWDDSFTYHYDEITETIMFCVKVPEKGFSNAVTIKETDGVPVGDNGGDRTGVDRPGGGLLGGINNPGDDNTDDDADGEPGGSLGDTGNDNNGGDTGGGTGADNSGGNNGGDNNNGGNNSSDTGGSTSTGNFGGGTDGSTSGKNSGEVAGSGIDGNTNDSNAGGDNHSGNTGGAENEGVSANNRPVDSVTNDSHDAQQIAKHNDGVSFSQSDTRGKGSMEAGTGVIAPAFHPQETPARPFVSTHASGLALALFGFAALACLAALAFLMLRGLKVKP